ncbi:hypothetical protein NDU88_005896 [Pleurodeles waltl]|uniref:Uncharacterized protein n=1 Tax=Pleurodeles waltl TaxID=8319 RepID=A0AAV7MAP4_PLEWA|nr:hypothetical protein NDU88_005896 [Pleurodeles waltl]
MLGQLAGMLGRISSILDSGRRGNELRPQFSGQRLNVVSPFVSGDRRLSHRPWWISNARLCLPCRRRLAGRDAEEGRGQVLGPGGCDPAAPGVPHGRRQPDPAQRPQHQGPGRDRRAGKGALEVRGGRTGLVADGHVAEPAAQLAPGDRNRKALGQPPAAAACSQMRAPAALLPAQPSLLSERVPASRRRPLFRCILSLKK